MKRIALVPIIICLFSTVLCTAPAQAGTERFRVFVVMSYGLDYEWSAEEKAGIDAALADCCKVEYFCLNTRDDPDKGPQKAQEALDRYRKLRPHGVIAADDNAQTLLVVPHLKGQVETPVMFCGVNADPEDYGYPASNVSGVLEQLQIGNSIAFAQQIEPSIRSFAFIARDTPTTRLARQQYDAGRRRYRADAVAFETPSNLEEALAAARNLAQQCDALFYETMEGIPNRDDKRLTDREVLPMIAAAFGKPIIANESYHIEYGALCGVVKSGREQGATAARMLLKAMSGTPMNEIPIIRRLDGVKMVNLTVLEAFGIRPDPPSMQGVVTVK